MENYAYNNKKIMLKYIKKVINNYYFVIVVWVLKKFFEVAYEKQGVVD